MITRRPWRLRRHWKNSDMAGSSTLITPPELLTTAIPIKEQTMILAGHLAKAADELAPPDCPLMVHASLRSFAAPIAGGADTLLDVLLTRRRTVMVPAFTEPQFGLTAPAIVGPARNGIDYTTLPAAPPPPEGAPYAADCGLINPGLGVFPSVLISRAGAVRGGHPLNSFAALGPLADELIAAQNPVDVYGPIRQLAAHAGLILLIGVGLNRMTALHLAEQQSGRHLFLRWARGADGQPSMFEVGSCSEGFPQLEPALHPHVRTMVVGGSLWRAYPAKQTLAAATIAITEDQGITHCPDDDCLLCRDSIAGGPIEATSGGSLQDPATPVPPSAPGSTPAVCPDESEANLSPVQRPHPTEMKVTTQ